MKMKRLVGFILIVCMTVGIFYPTGQVSAEAESTETTNPTYTLNGKEYEVYYEDDFSDGGTKYTAATTGFDTTDYSRIMGVENKSLMKLSTLGEDGSQYRALFTDTGAPSTNYSVSATFKMKDTAKFTAVTAYAKDSGAGYEFGLIGTYFRIWNRSNGKVIVGDSSNLATTYFGNSFDATSKEISLRLEASTVDNIVTLKGYATYSGVEKLVCEATSDKSENMSLKSGTPGLVSSDTGAPISFVSITSLGEETDSNCLYSDDMTGQTGYRNALGYALSDSDYEYTWSSTTKNLTTNSSEKTYSAFKGITNATELQNYTISADVVEETLNKANGLVAYMTLSGDGGSTGYEFRLYQGKFSIHGRNTSITAPDAVSVTSYEGWEDYTQGQTVRLSMTVLTSAVSDSQGTVRIICAAEYKDQVRCIFDTSYTEKGVYQGAPGIRTNDTAGTIDNVKVTAVGALPFYADFEENVDIAASIFGSNLTVTTETIGSETNTYGTVSSGDTVCSAIGASWTDYTVDADVTMIKDETTTKAQYAGLIAGYIEGVDNGYEFDIYEVYTKDEDGTSYLATTETYMARLLDKNTNKVVKSVRFDFTPGETVQMRMEVSGTQISCYADGELLIRETVTLPDGHTGTEITGSIGLRAITASVKYDNISVESYEASEETEESAFPFVEDFDSNRAELSEIWNNGRIVKLEKVEEDQHAVLANYYMPEDAEEGYTAYDTSVTNMYLTGIADAATWTNYVYEADVTLTDAPIGTNIWKVAAIVGAVQNSKGYEFGICYNGTSYGVRLYDRINGATLVGQNASSSDGYELCTFEFDETVRLKMVVSGNKIQCYVNDELKIDYIADENTIFSGTIGLVASGNAAKFDNIIVSSAADYYPLAKYRSDDSNYTHPYKSGHVFGGWYQDNQYTTPLAADATTTTESGCAYAKWVAEEVLSVKAQLPAGDVVDDKGRTVMRIVTTTDCDAYTETGFDVSTVNQSKTYTDTRLFTSIKAKSEYASVAVDYTPSETFHETSQYFSTIILYNLKATEEHLTKVFTIKPFWVTADGTKVYGVTRNLTIQEGIDALTDTNPYSL